MTTIIDRLTIGRALQPVDGQVEWVPDYELPDGSECFAIRCTRRDYTQFMIELAAIDVKLATDLHDIAQDVGPGRELTFYFADYEVEPDDDVNFPKCDVCGDPIDYCQGHGDEDEPQPRHRSNPNEDENRSRGISAL